MLYALEDIIGGTTYTIYQVELLLKTFDFFFLCIFFSFFFSLSCLTHEKSHC